MACRLLLETTRVSHLLLSLQDVLWWRGIRVISFEKWTDGLPQSCARGGPCWWCWWDMRMGAEEIKWSWVSFCRKAARHRIHLSQWSRHLFLGTNHVHLMYTSRQAFTSSCNVKMFWRKWYKTEGDCQRLLGVSTKSSNMVFSLRFQASAFRLSPHHRHFCDANRP